MAQRQQQLLRQRLRLAHLQQVRQRQRAPERLQPVPEQQRQA